MDVSRVLNRLKRRGRPPCGALLSRHPFDLEPANAALRSGPRPGSGLQPDAGSLGRQPPVR